MLHTKGRDAVHSLRYSWSTRTRHQASYFGWLWRGHCLQLAQKAQHVANGEPIAQHPPKAAQPAAAAATATAPAEASQPTPTPTPTLPLRQPVPSPLAAELPASTGDSAANPRDAPREASLSPPAPHADGFVHLPDLSTRHAGTLVDDAVEPSARERQSQAIIDSVSRERHSLFLGALFDSFTAAICCGCHFTIG